MTSPGSEERPEILESHSGWWTTLPLPRPPRPPRRLLLMAAALVLACGGAVLAINHGDHGSPGQTGRPPTGPNPAITFIPTACGHFTSTRVPTGSRVILGDVAVPPAYVGPMLPNGNGEWRYWRKAVFGVRDGSPPLTLSVLADQQYNAAIDLEINGIGSIFHLPGCPPSYGWHVAVGGFYLKAPAACLALQVQVGQRTAIAWFGLGRPCSSFTEGLTGVGTGTYQNSVVYEKPLISRISFAQAVHSRVVARQAAAGFATTVGP